MKTLNAKAKAVFGKLVEGLDGDNPYRKIDNADGVFMPVHVDFLYESEHGKVYAIAHNYTQAGDVMADPDMEFLANERGVFPLTYQQDGLGVFQVGLAIQEGKLLIAPKLQADLAVFANTWMANIKDQQEL